MKEIILNNNRNLYKIAIVDDEDYEYLSQYKWYYSSCGYAITKINKKTIGMHRLVNKTLDGFVTDHINHNKLDNRKSNLRSCSILENSRNSSVKDKIRIGGCKYKGVHYDKSRFKYKAEIMIKGKNIFIGRFNTEIAAAIAYNKAAKKYFGEFACLNIIRGE